MKQYQRSVARFIDYLDEVGIAPNGAEEWDDMLVEYKNDRALTKGQFASTISGVEFFFPRYKPLKWSHRVSDAMAIEAEVEHTMPMLPNAANLIASRMALKGYATVGAMLVLAVTVALRPSDAYRKLKPKHVHIPSDPTKPAVIRLGAKTGTKVKREQFAMIDQQEHAEVILMLKRWISVTPPDAYLCDVGYDKVNALLKEVCRELGLNFSFTPHSPRAGFATNGVIQGKTTETIMTEGRWASRGSFVRYLDVIVAAQVQTQLELSAFESDMSLAQLNMSSLLSARSLDCYGYSSQCKVTHFDSRAESAANSPQRQAAKPEGTVIQEQQSFGPVPVGTRNREHASKGKSGPVAPRSADSCLAPADEKPKARGKGHPTQTVRTARAGKGGSRGPTRPR